MATLEFTLFDQIFHQINGHDSRALSRIIDEWDDRPWQGRRRLALSLGYVSRWEEKYLENQEDFDVEDNGAEDVKTYLQARHLQLLEDYLGGQTKGAEAARQIFQEAIRLSIDPHRTMFGSGKNMLNRDILRSRLMYWKNS